MTQPETNTWAILVACMLPVVSVGAAEPPSLEHNPFSRPASGESAPGSARNSTIAGLGSALELNATMVASTHRLANIGGRILRPGDDFEGYTLMHVYEDRAVFLHNGERVTVFVKPETGNADE